MRILIVGAGAIGGVTAAYMAEGGIDVTLVCRRQAVSDAILKTGFHIIGKRGEHYAKLNAVADYSGLEGKYDFCLVATKAYDLEEAASRALPFLKPDGLVVSMQNGMCIDKLALIAGPERTAAAITTWSCTMLGDAFMEITGEGCFIVGMVSGREDPRLKELKDAMEKMAPTRITRDITGEIFSKFIINSGITCGGAMTGRTLGQMLVGKRARDFFIGIVKEDIAVAAALGINVPPFGGKLDYYGFIKGNSLLSVIRRHVILFVVGLKYRKLKSSSLTSLQRGGKTEVDFLNGWISKKGAELGVPTPVNDRVVGIIREIEAGQRKICPENILKTITGATQVWIKH